jgi:tetratricopeptide (TPR) repeat protein
MADVLYLTGRLSAAAKMWDEAIAIDREIGSEEFLALALSGKGDVFAAEGRLAPARKHYDEAVAIYRKIDMAFERASVLNKLAAVRMDQGDLVATFRLSDQARQVQTQSVSSDGNAEGDVVAARLLLEQGKRFEAQSHARTAVQRFHDHHWAMNEITARLVLARCWLAEGKLAETQAELHGIAAFLKRSQNQLLRIDFLITAARTQAASGEIVESLETVKTALKESARCGLVGSHLEALLAKGEIEMKANNSSAAAIDLATAQHQAEAIGYGLIVAKAAKALRDTGKRPGGASPE